MSSPGIRRGRLLAIYAVAALAAILVVIALSLWASQQVGTQEAVSDARSTTQVLAATTMAEIPNGLLTGDPAAIAAIDAVVRSSVLRPDIARVKIWRGDGTILYSDEQRLIGTAYPLGAEEQQVLQYGGIEAEPSDLTKPENQYEQEVGRMLEVYLPVATEDRTRLLFEVYYRGDALTDASRRIWTRFAPIIIGGLLLLALLELPLAWWLVNRAKRDEAEKQELLQSAVDASEAERHRIASDLHDGVVQDLTGVSYALVATAGRLRAEGSGAAESVDEAATHTRTAVSALRSLLIEIYPPNLRDAGLAAALDGLLAGPRSRGLTATLAADPDTRLPEETEALIYRAAQEALRNVVTHSQATRVDIALVESERTVTLTVADDGRGLAGGDWRAPASGHAGLRLLADLAARDGGSLTVDDGTLSGVVLTLEVAR